MDKNIDWEKIANTLENAQDTSLNPEEEEAFHQAKYLWEEAKALGSKGSIVPPTTVADATRKMWARIEQEVTSTKSTEAPKAKKRSIWPRIAVAASLLIPALLYFAWPQNNNPSSFDGLITVTAAEEELISLPDGSEARLATGRLSYTFDQNTQCRKVALAGNAFFEVASNKAYPFVIESKDAVVTVVGTSFQLDAAPNEAMVRLLVNTGKVAFKPVGADWFSTVYAVKGEEVIYDTKEQLITKRFIESNQYISSKKGYIAFDATLGELVAFIVDWSGKEVVISDPSIASINLTSTQGLVYTEAGMLLQKAILPIADKVRIFEQDGRIEIQKK